MKKLLFRLPKTPPASLGKIYVFLFVTGVLLLGFLLGRNQTELLSAGDTVSVRQLKNMIAKGNTTLINVHTPYEGEIERTNAIIAFDKIVEQSSALPKDKNAPIVLYCKSGRMSEEALLTIRKLGYTNVKHLSGGMEQWEKSGGKILNLSTLEASVLPKDGITLPVAWKDIGQKLTRAGVINYPEFKKVVSMTPEQIKILTEGSEDNININAANSQFVVDVLWALGLAQKSIVYTDGPLGKEYANQQGDFASTGGWSLSEGNAVNYLNKFDFISLTADQQMKVGEIAKNVYRPCCGNSTWFPDCNHGMAALAVIELLVSANIPETDIYRYVLGFNSFWFPDSYLTVATYFARSGTSWNNVNAKEVLGEKFSSGKGAGEISKKVGPLPNRPTTGGSCGA